jgi:RNA polymerase sigma-70 factor (ECF subfamily)
VEKQTMRDEELVALVARSDRTAFETLYDRHASRALGLAMRIFRDQPLAEDIVQEAFWRVWKRAGTFDTERGHFSSWLLSIVHHLSIDRLRAGRGAPATVTIDSEFNAEMDVRDMSQDVAEQAWAKLQSGAMRDALTQLPEAQRAVIEMAYFEGLTHQEISERLSEPLGTIHTRARLGLSKLRELLRELQGQEH